MEAIIHTPRTISPAARWSGLIISGLPVLLLLFSGGMKLVAPYKAVDMFNKLGWAPSAALGLGVTEVTCTILYLIPQTSVIGAILLTGYMGGAIATHLRIGDPPIVQALVPILLWLGLFLREPRLRALLPFRTSSR